MSQPRFELYINVHKGLRYLFGQILYQAGRIDYSSDTDLDKFAVQLDELTTYLEDHADNEEECVLKPLEQRAPDAIKRDLEVHVRLVEEQKKFVALFSEVRQQRDKEKRLNAGLTFYWGLADFVSIYLPHMLEEEKDTMGALWKHFNDEELVGMFQSIMEKTKPETLMMMLKYILPALNRYERAGLLAGMRSSAPEPAFQAVMKLAKGILPAEEFEQVESGLKVA